MANKQIIRNKSKKFNNNSTKLKNRLGNRKNTSPVKDARLKIIRKKRSNVVDARDILAKMAKSEDARNKIQRLRETRQGVNMTQTIGSSILKRTDRNGKISLVTNKVKQSSEMKLAIHKQLGLVGRTRSPIQRAIKQTVVNAPPPPPRAAPPPIIRKTIQNDHFGTNPYIHSIDDSLYKWVRPMERLELRQRVPIQPNRFARLANTYIDLDAVEDEEMPLVTETIALQGLTRSSNVHSRLDSIPVQPESHGILSQTKTKVIVPAGHRIVVSNLQPTVTQDDIKELFEDIGQLLVARLVRPGTAEVIYKNLKDAQKAVDTYHNRQLDGQPMKCLLVNKRPLNSPTALAVPKTTTEGILSPNRKSTTASSAKLVPDLGIVHKVLFKRK